MSTETDAQLNALKEEIAAVRQENEKAWTLARDCYNALVNAKTVGTNGKLGALSGADTLSQAPVGDAGSVRAGLGLGAMAQMNNLSDAQAGDSGLVRSRLGLGAMATANNLSDVEAGDSANVRNKLGLSVLSVTADWNDIRNNKIKFYSIGDNMLQPYESTQICFVEAHDKNANQWQGWHLPSEWCNVLYGSGTEKNNAIGIASAQGPSQEYWISGRNAWGNGAFKTWCKLLHSNNTTVDSNGFIKTASPIIRIGERQDTITSRGFSPAGYGATNQEADGATCERKEEGVYVISGSLGLSDDGIWSIETPLDLNNQPVLWVEKLQDENGVITIKTYHRTNASSPSFAQNIVEGKKDGDPIDIPDGRWIDLKLKMPEKVAVKKEAP